MYDKKGKLAVISDPADGGPERIVVFGDIHGDIKSLKAGLDLCEENDLFLFLGDYADRGRYGIEVIEGISKLMDTFPERIIALMGNHEQYTREGKPIFSPCTLLEEAEKKKGSWQDFWPFFSGFVSRLYLSAILPGFALFTHGGIPASLTSTEELISPRDIANDLLWSDPGAKPGASANTRGIGTLFGPDISEEVLASLGVPSLIRSHEPRKAASGPAVEHEGRVITTSTTRVYGGRPFILVLDPSVPPAEQILSPEEYPKAVRFL
jgi:protein phosphatase